MSGKKRFAGLKDHLINHLNAVGSRGLAAIGSKSRAKLQEDEKTVTLQVGKSVFEGAPRNMRTELWMSSLQRKGIGVAASKKYEDMLLAPVGAEAAADIEKDLDRTFPRTRRFAAAEGQEALRRVLMAYAAFDPEVGYCQGLNFVAGLLLMYLPERHAFGGLVVLMQDRGLRNYYSTDMSLIQTHLWQLGRLVPTRLCTHLESIGVLPLLYGASWLMTCFSADFPASFSARVMDVIMSDKMDQALLKAAVGLLKRCEMKLLQMHDMEDALHLLKLELPAWEEPLLHDVLTEAFAKPWSSRQMQLLGSLEGAETVAEALTRVQRANLAASMDSLPSGDSNAFDESTAASPSSVSAGGVVGGNGGASVHGSSSSRSATPSQLSAGGTAAAGGGCGSSGAAPVSVLPLFPPPPSPRRPSSAGAASACMSPVSSRGVSRATSQSGSAWQAGSSDPSAAATAAAAAAAAACGTGLLPATQGAQSVPSLQRLGLSGQPEQQQQQQQQQQHLDMIDMSSPRASSTPAAAGSLGGQVPAGKQQHAAGDAWDPFGLGEAAATAPSQQLSSGGSSQQQQQQARVQEQACLQSDTLQLPQHQQQQQQAPSLAATSSTSQELLQQQLQDLSFTQLSTGPRPEPAPQLHDQQQQQHHQQQQHVAADEDWGDFLSPPHAGQ